ncbi:MAG: Gfo/Idh/MocA family oxidoreductase [Spirochaetales bacterium]|jgi:predicted dehydrogenase|nr:Gfo/Idh/MocA family oxidoreductase [Spirochaetales bacterium]
MESKPIIEKRDISIGILGLTPGNGHPYSWSAMFNGYDKEKMTAECFYAGIPEYLNKEPAESFGVDGAKVTHISCTGEGDFEAEHAAACSLIPNVVSDPKELIGEVDAVIVATDIGHEHVERCRPFVEAGIPIFVDKPMVDNTTDLKIFEGWVSDGASIVSSSSMRYTKEFGPYRLSTRELGTIRYATITSAKYWETYGIHALEAIYAILGPGFLTCRNTGTKTQNVVHFTHGRGADVVVVVSKDMFGGFGYLTLCGTHGSVQLKSGDSFFSFKSQLDDYVRYLRTGVRSYPFSETVELMRMVIAGIESRQRDGALIEIT